MRGLSAELRANLVDELGTLDGAAILDQLSRIERDLGSNGQVAAESWGEFAGLRAKVDAILETSANETGAVSGLLDEVREALNDVASGEVMGALWDEFRDARRAIDALVADVEQRRDAAAAAPEPLASDPVADRLGQLQSDVIGLSGAVQELILRAEDAEQRARESAAAPPPVDDGMVALRTEVSGLTFAVRDLLEQAEVVDDSAETPNWTPWSRPSPLTSPRCGPSCPTGSSSNRRTP